MEVRGGEEKCFGEGWHVFVEENGVEIGDILIITCLGGNLFKVDIWRAGVEITRNTILISSDSSDDDGDGDDTMEPIQPPPPSFKFQFIKSYISKQTIYVPVSFAHAYFNGLKDPLYC